MAFDATHWYANKFEPPKDLFYKSGDVVLPLDVIKLADAHFYLVLGMACCSNIMGCPKVLWVANCNENRTKTSVACSYVIALEKYKLHSRVHFDNTKWRDHQFGDPITTGKLYRTGEQCQIGDLVEGYKCRAIVLGLAYWAPTERVNIWGVRIEENGQPKLDAPAGMFNPTVANLVSRNYGVTTSVEIQAPQDEEQSFRRKRDDFLASIFN